MASVEFNGQELIRELDLATRVQLPFLAAVTVNRLASQVRKDLQREILDSFTYVSSFTYTSPKQRHFASKAEPWTEVYLRDEAVKGQAPAKYLLPQITGGMVYRTRFQNRLERELQGYNGRYMLPLANSPAAELNQLGRIRAQQYVSALYGVKAMETVRASNRQSYRTLGSYMYVPLGPDKEKAKVIRGLNKGRLPGPGIYKVENNSMTQVFKQLSRIPTVEKRFDFAYASQLSVERNFQQIFDRAADEFVRKI